MSESVSRKFESLMSDKLMGLVVGVPVLTHSGGGDCADAQYVEPPFAVVGVTGCERMTPHGDVWKLSGAVQVVTHMAEARPRQHSELGRRYADALLLVRFDENDGMVLHGLDVGTYRAAEDDSGKYRVDAVDFVAGVTG